MKKYKESKIDPFNIKFNNIELISIISYPPAYNDVFECIGKYKNKNRRFFLKLESGKFSNIKNEIKLLNILNNYDLKIPKVLDYGENYIVLSKLYGYKLSNIIKKNNNSMDYLFEYGKSLAKFHSVNIKYDISMKRKINNVIDINIKEYPEFKEIYHKLINNIPKFNNDTFIHGDYHYGNILFKDKKVSGILDFEYSGMGFKEQDIAWSIVLKNTQKFLNTKEEIYEFLNGYKSVCSFNIEYFKWCYINSILHLYIMNNDELYRKRIIKMIEIINEVNYE